MFEGTLDPVKDTQDLRKKGWFNNPNARFPFNNRGEAEVVPPVTFTQAEVDTKVSEGIEAHKTAAATGSFFDGFAPELKAHPSVVRYKSSEELAKGFVNLEKTIGLKGTLVPTENSSDEVRAKFYKDTGVPDNLEGYVSPVMEGMHKGLESSSAEDAKWFKDLAFKAKLTPAQHDIIFKDYIQLSSQRLTDYDKMTQDANDLASTALRGKWGGNFEANEALANGLLKKFGGDKAASLEAKFKGDPEMIEFLHNIGSQLSEDKLGEIGRSGMGMNPEQAKIEINTLMKQIMDTKQDDPIYQDLLKRKDTLYKIAYPSPQKV